MPAVVAKLDIPVGDPVLTSAAHSASALGTVRVSARSETARKRHLDRHLVGERHVEWLLLDRSGEKLRIHFDG